MIENVDRRLLGRYRSRSCVTSQKDVFSACLIHISMAMCSLVNHLSAVVGRHTDALVPSYKAFSARWLLQAVDAKTEDDLFQSGRTPTSTSTSAYKLRQHLTTRWLAL